MATYAEILLASENELLRNKTKVACVVASEVVRKEAPATPNHTNRLIWAKSVYQNPDDVMRDMLWAVLGQNVALPYLSIINATDAEVQTAVNAAVDVFATGV